MGLWNSELEELGRFENKKKNMNYREQEGGRLIGVQRNTINAKSGI